MRVDRCYGTYSCLDHGGISGTEIDFGWEDGVCAVPKAITAYKRFKERGMALCLLFFSPQTETLTPRARQDGIPLMWPMGLTPGILNKISRWIFAGHPEIGSKAAIFMEWVLEGTYFVSLT